MLRSIKRRAATEDQGRPDPQGLAPGAHGPAGQAHAHAFAAGGITLLFYSSFYGWSRVEVPFRQVKARIFGIYVSSCWA